MRPLALVLLLAPALAAAAAPVANGSATATGTGATVSATLTTTGAGCVIAVAISNDTTGSATVSISGGGLTWASALGPVRQGSNSGFAQFFKATSAGAISAQSITATFSASAQESLVVLGYSGTSAACVGATASLAEQATYDSNYPIDITATAAESIILGALHASTTGTFTAGTGGTEIFEANTGATHYVVQRTAATTAAGAYNVTPVGPNFIFYIPAAIEILAGAGGGGGETPSPANSGMMGFW